MTIATGASLATLLFVDFPIVPWKLLFIAASLPIIYVFSKRAENTQASQNRMDIANVVAAELRPLRDSVARETQQLGYGDVHETHQSPGPNLLKVLDEIANRERLYGKSLRKRILQECGITKWEMGKYRIARFINWVLAKHD